MIWQATNTQRLYRFKMYPECKQFAELFGGEIYIIYTGAITLYCVTL